MIGFWLVHLLHGSRRRSRKGIAELFGAVEMGDLEVVIGGVRPLSEARQVHEDLAARRTQGKILLDPPSPVTSSHSNKRTRWQDLRLVPRLRESGTT